MEIRLTSSFLRFSLLQSLRLQFRTYQLWLQKIRETGLFPITKNPPSDQIAYKLGIGLTLYTL